MADSCGTNSNILINSLSFVVSHSSTDQAMERITCIPEAQLMCILMDWLALKDLARLDSAACDSDFRNELHHSIAESPHAYSKMWTDGENPSVHWLIKRGIKCSIVCLGSNVLKDPELQKMFLIHSGPTIQRLHLEPTDRANCINNILPLLSSYCMGLKHLTISESWDTSYLPADFFVHLQALLNDHPSLQHLSFRHIEKIPPSIILVALAKLKYLSLEGCTVVEDVPVTSLHTATKYNNIFKCYTTSLPSRLCALVTNVTVHCFVDVEEISHYAKLSEANLCYLRTSLDSTIVQRMCSHWQLLLYLRFDHTTTISEESTLLFVKHLRLLRELNTCGYLETDDCNNNNAVSVENHCLHSQLTKLSMRCDHSSTLQEVLHLCPQLTTLSLVSWRRVHVGDTTFLRIEKSLHLIHNTSIKAIHLRDYTELCNADIAALHCTQLNTLTITKAGEKLHDKAILQLLPTLSGLHTLDLSECDSLSYRLVLQVPLLCPNLRSYTYYRSAKGIHCSVSSKVFKEVLPKIFPHVKSFCIFC